MYSDPERQALFAQELRRRKASDALLEANQQASQYDTLAAITQLANNPAAASAAGSAQKSAQSRYKPLSLGQQGFALPSSGQFVPSPIYEDERKATRQTQKQLAQDRIIAQQRHDQLMEQGRMDRASQANALREMLARMAQEGMNNRASDANALRLMLAAMQGGNKGEKETNTAISNYTKALEKGNIPAIQSGLDQVNQVFNQYQKGDIPGYGAVTNALPSWMISNEGKNNRVSMQMTANQILRGLSGQAVTGPENQRFLTAVGQGVGMSDEQLRRGWAGVMQELAEKRRNFNTMLTPEQMDVYRARGGRDYTNYDLPQWANEALAPPKPGDKYLK